MLFSGIPHLPIFFALQVARWQVARWPGDRWHEKIGQWGIPEKSIQNVTQQSKVIAEIFFWKSPIVLHCKVGGP